MYRNKSHAKHSENLDREIKKVRDDTMVSITNHIIEENSKHLGQKENK